MLGPELFIEGTKTMPAISFRNGRLNIVGRSIPQDTKKIYDKLLEVLYNYYQRPKEKTEINIQLEYLNSESNRSLMNILMIAEKLHSRGNNVVIRWFYKDNDVLMFDQGKIFKSLLEVPFKFEPIN